MKIFKLVMSLILILNCTTAFASSKLSDTVNNFNWNYYKTLDKSKNIFYSPYGISAALSIVANGAMGDTKREILSALSAYSVSSLNRNFGDFRLNNNSDDDDALSDANLILIDESLIGNGINSRFKNTAEKFYNAEIATANFSGNFQGEHQRIKTWVDKNTNHFIPNYESSTNADTTVDLLNVIYFKSTWLRPFKTYNTSSFNFTGKNGSKNMVEMMIQDFDRVIQYYEDDKYRAIALPYDRVNNAIDVEMYIILPVDKTALNIADTWNDETVDYKKDFLMQVKNAPNSSFKINLWLPKFEMEIKNDLIENLKAMGITRAFSDDADFSKIVRNVDMKINSATHQAKVKVDEKGTEAAAVTDFEMVGITSVGFVERPVEFHADIPFIFVIREVDNEIDLFTGVVNNLK